MALSSRFRLMNLKSHLSQEIESLQVSWREGIHTQWNRPQVDRIWSFLSKVK